MEAKWYPYFSRRGCEVLKNVQPSHSFRKGQFLFYVRIFLRRFSMVEHSNGEESVSRFLIAPILDQDGGEVVCEVSNRYGRDAKTFLLSIEGRNSIFLCESKVCISRNLCSGELG